MGRLPADVRAMTPEATALLIQAWNDAQGDGMAAPTRAQMDELREAYPDA